MRAPSIRAVATTVAVVMLLPACGNFGRAGQPPPSQTPQSYGQDLEFTPLARDRSRNARLRFVLASTDGAAIGGAYVEYKGDGRSGQFVTDERGIATGVVKPGVYKVTVPHCGRDVLINGEAGGRISVSRGVTLKVALAPVDWEWRYAPTPSVVSSRDAPWKRGRAVTLGVKVIDYCDFSPAPNRTLTSHAWQFSGPFTGTATTPRSDGEAFAHVQIRCTRRGDGRVLIVDRFDATKVVDLIESLSGPSDGGPFCR